MVLTISDQNLRRDLEDLVTLSDLGLVLSARYTVAKLTLTNAFIVNLPHLLSILTIMLNKMRGVRSVIISIL